MDTHPQLCNEKQLAPYAQKYKAIGHPIRLKILCLIAHQEVPCVGDIWRCLDQPQPVVSQHLAILKRNGIVSSEVKKTRRIYSISDPFIKNLVDAMIAEIRAPSDETSKNK
ncbi:MAG: metalloregulator ArsR/SmtB family transcription factor [Rectinema sp.]